MEAGQNMTIFSNIYKLPTNAIGISLKSIWKLSNVFIYKKIFKNKNEEVLLSNVCFN